MRRARVRVHSRENAQRKKLREQVRTAVAHKWNSSAGHGQKTEIDAHMQGKVRPKVAQHSHGKKRLEIGRSAHGAVQYPPKQHAVQSKQEHCTGKPPFLGESRENKIRLILGKKTQFTLRAIPYALANELSGADRHRRLIGVIARAVDVRKRIQKS